VRSFRTATGQDRGAVIPLVAMVLPVLIIMTAFAVDLGRQRESRRAMQAAADVIALDLVRLTDGRTSAAIHADPASEAEIQRSAARNGIARARVLDVEWGEYRLLDPDDPESFAFVSHRNGPTYEPGLTANAVRVTTNETTDYMFQPGSGEVTRSAVATRDDLASVTLGTTLVSVRLGEIDWLNHKLTGLLCPTVPPPAPPPPLSLCPNRVNFGLAGYQGLADADVDLDQLRAASGVGTVDELLDSEVTVSELASLFATALRNDGRTAEAALLDGGGTSLARLAANLTTRFRVRDIVGVDVPAPGAAAGGRVNPLDAFDAAAQVANGDNFLDVGGAVPPLTLPAGISNLTLTSRYQVIEAPRSGIGRVGSAAMRPPNLRTAQLRVFTELHFDLNLTVAGTGVTGRVSLPVDIRGGGADAQLLAIDCAFPPEHTTIDMLAVPRTVFGRAGHPTDPIGRVNVTVTLPLLGPVSLGLVDLRAHGLVDPDAPTTVGQILEQIAIGETALAAGNGFGMGGSITTVGLNVVGHDLTLLTGLIRSTLNALLSALDVAMRPVLNRLGMSVTEAAVTNVDASCDAVKLVG
jgi:uncharacterized membrane protein